MNELQMRVHVDRQLQLIKSKMPETYMAIKHRVMGLSVPVRDPQTGDQVMQVLIPAQGEEIYGLVRRAIRGEANCFYAIEGGHEVGTPFVQVPQVVNPIADLMRQFGCLNVCMFGLPAKEVAHGAD